MVTFKSFQACSEMPQMLPLLFAGFGMLRIPGHWEWPRAGSWRLDRARERGQTGPGAAAPWPSSIPTAPGPSFVLPRASQNRGKHASDLGKSFLLTALRDFLTFCLVLACNRPWERRSERTGPPLWLPSHEACFLTALVLPEPLGPCPPGSASSLLWL